MNIKLNNVETCAVLDALGFHMRIWMGQYEELLRCTGYLCCTLGTRDVEQALREFLGEIRALLLPSLFGYGIGCSPGIWSDDTDRRAICAYDMKQSLRFARSWHLFPEGGMTVNFDDPWIRGDLPELVCSCSGEKEDFSMEVGMTPVQVALAAEALDTWDKRLKGNVIGVFERYTRNEEVFELANKTVPLLKEIADDAGWVVSARDGTRSRALRTSSPSFPRLQPRRIGRSTT